MARKLLCLLTAFILAGMAMVKDISPQRFSAFWTPTLLPFSSLLLLFPLLQLCNQLQGQAGTDPNAEDIDTAAFTARFNLSKC